MEDEVDREEESRGGRRARQPRFGSFVTIAAALLMLFGAASRLGKVQETASLFGIDGAAQERIRREDLRNVSIANIGARPVPQNRLRPESNQVSVRPNAQPPHRGDFEINGRIGLNSVAPVSPRIEDFPYDDPEDYPLYEDQAPVRAPEPVRPAPQRSRTYTVANGDTLAKIASRTLGDGNRWRDILRANPNVDGGKLRVGMELVIP